MEPPDDPLYRSGMIFLGKVCRITVLSVMVGPECLQNKSTVVFKYFRDEYFNIPEVDAFQNCIHMLPVNIELAQVIRL